jgi:hypothetical protein
MGRINWDKPQRGIGEQIFVSPVTGSDIYLRNLDEHWVKRESSNSAATRTFPAVIGVSRN